ncbi:MAG: hypothetical protein K1X94_30385 [Sandaracinaceae bacterium]|nr:hypothetical protein [Sandaracinaceae bacterium]
MRRPELRLIRDALEAVLSPELAAATVDEAVRAMPNALSSPAELVALVNGPLRTALTKRQGSAADDVIDDLLRVLVARTPSPKTSSQDITREIMLETAQVFVFVLSSSEALAGELERVLGTQLVATLTYDEPQRVRKAIGFKPPSIVLIDGASFPLIEPSDLPEILGALPPTSVRAVWGTDTPYGAAAVAELTAKRVAFTPLDRREGVTPVVDLVRARRVR